MKGLKLLIKNRKAGITLMELLVAAALMCSMIAMAMTAIAPGVKIILHMHKLNDTQIVMDALLDDVCAQIEQAKSSIMISPDGSEIQFTISKNQGLAISTEGSPERSEGLREPVPAIPEGFAFYRQYNTTRDTAIVKPFPDGFYGKTYAKLHFQRNNNLIIVTADMYSDPGRTELICSDQAVAEFRYSA